MTRKVRDSESNIPGDVSSNLREILEGAGLGAASEICRIHEVWEQVVGGHLAQHVQPVHVHGTILVLAVDSPMWANELTFLKQQILMQLAKQENIPYISDLRTRIDDGR